MVGEISDSFSMLHQIVSRGSWGSQGAFGSETAEQAPRHDRRQLPVMDPAASRTAARDTANQLPALAGGHRANVEAQRAQGVRCSCSWH